MAVDLIPATIKNAHLRRRRLQYWAFALAAFFLALATLTALRYLACLRLASDNTRNQQELNVIKADLAALANNEDQLEHWTQRIAILTALQNYSDPLAAIETLRTQTPQLVYLNNMSFAPSDPADTSSTHASTLPKAAAMFAIKDDNNKNTTTLATLTPDALTISGQASTHQTVGQYLDILQKCPTFQQTLLINARRSPTQDNNLANTPVDFEMSLRLRK